MGIAAPVPSQGSVTWLLGLEAALSPARSGLGLGCSRKYWLNKSYSG